jgi:hypothetical protein
MRGGGKLGVSPAAPPSFCHKEALSGSIEIPELFPSAGVVHYRAHRHHDGEVFAILTVAVGPFPMPSPARLEEAIVAELQQGVDPLGAFQGDITAPPTVPSAGSTTRNELFPAEGNATIPARAAGNMDLGFVNEHVECTTP